MLEKFDPMCEGDNEEYMLRKIRDLHTPHIVERDMRRVEYFRTTAGGGGTTNYAGTILGGTGTQTFAPTAGTTSTEYYPVYNPFNNTTAYVAPSRWSREGFY